MTYLKALFCAQAALLILTAPAMSAVVDVLSATPATGTAIDLSVKDFERLGNCGGGHSVVNDGCSVVMKNNPAAPHAFGRFDPPPQDYWIDSQDIDELKWTVSNDQAFTSMTFALTDAHDQANSWFDMSFLDGDDWVSIWSLPTQLGNGNLQWLRVDFGNAVTSAAFQFSTKVGGGYDGYGISSLSVDLAPVPVPGAAMLLLTGGAALVGLRARKKRRS